MSDEKPILAGNDAGEQLMGRIRETLPRASAAIEALQRENADLRTRLRAAEGQLAALREVIHTSAARCPACFGRDDGCWVCNRLRAALAGSPAPPQEGACEGCERLRPLAELAERYLDDGLLRQASLRGAAARQPGAGEEEEEN